VSAADPPRAGTRRTFSSDRLIEHLQELLPRFPHVSLCVACSGGVDSTALLASLARVRGRTFGLRAAHIDHGLHPDSALWSRQCRQLARRLGVPLRVVRIAVARPRGASLEEAARSARYRALGALLKPDEVLLTAHNQDDQLETVLLQLFRGCGLPGLAAMPAAAPFAGTLLVRPLLRFSRAELAAWVEAEGLPVVVDATNADERFDRNYLRRQVLPAVRARWSGVAAAVARTARHAAEGQQLLEALARADVERASDGAALSVKALRRLPLPRRRNALRFWIASGAHPLPDARRLEQIAGPVLEARADAHPEVAWGRVRIERHADRLSLGAAVAQADRSVPAGELLWPVGTASRCALPEGCGELELRADPHGPLDLDALGASVTVRWRRGGERLRLRPGGARRALKSLLQEARVPLAERARLPLLCRDGELVAVADLWLGASVRAQRGSRRRARLIWQKPPRPLR
jgi:tRNA(Ile)-lysidine synthase